MEPNPPHQKADSSLAFGEDDLRQSEIGRCIQNVQICSGRMLEARVGVDQR